MESLAWEKFLIGTPGIREQKNTKFYQYILFYYKVLSCLPFDDFHWLSVFYFFYYYLSFFFWINRQS
jgi:hypothetical protein